MGWSRITAAASIAFLLTCSFFTTSVRAGSLGLVKQYPDISITTGLTAGYSGGIFSVQGTGLMMSLDTIPGDPAEYVIVGGGYDLKAEISSGGVLNTSSLLNTLTITGTLKQSLTGPNLNSGAALTGKLTQFGYTPKSGGGLTFEFLFTVTGGYLKAPGFFGSGGGIIGSADSGTYSYGFSNDFTLSSPRVDTFVPTPMALPAGLVLLAGMGIVGWRRSASVTRDQLH